MLNKYFYFGANCVEVIFQNLYFSFWPSCPEVAVGKRSEGASSHHRKMVFEWDWGMLPQQAIFAKTPEGDFAKMSKPVQVCTACRLYREFLIQEVIRNSELSGTWFVIPFVPFSYKNKFPITFCLFLIFPNDDI